MEFEKHIHDLENIDIKDPEISQMLIELKQDILSINEQSFEAKELCDKAVFAIDEKNKEELMYYLEKLSSMEKKESKEAIISSTKDLENLKNNIPQNQLNKVNKEYLDSLTREQRDKIIFEIAEKWRENDYKEVENIAKELANNEKWVIWKLISYIMKKSI